MNTVGELFTEEKKGLVTQGVFTPTYFSHGLGRGQNGIKGQEALETRVNGSRGGPNGRFNDYVTVTIVWAEGNKTKTNLFSVTS